MSQAIISDVYEYQIMYTTQITQKVKKWNDGKLKYFDFNKKAQVFNEDGLVVSSAFLKNNSKLAASTWGEELKIGGVLITIDSLISESSRDIAKVFQKNSTPDQRTPGPLRTKQILSDSHRTSISPLTNKIIPRRRRIGLSKSATPSQLKAKQNDAVIREPHAVRKPSVTTHSIPRNNITIEPSNNTSQSPSLSPNLNDTHTRPSNSATPVITTLSPRQERITPGVASGRSRDQLKPTSMNSININNISKRPMRPLLVSKSRQPIVRQKPKEKENMDTSKLKPLQESVIERDGNIETPEQDRSPNDISKGNNTASNVSKKELHDDTLVKEQKELTTVKQENQPTTSELLEQISKSIDETQTFDEVFIKKERLQEQALEKEFEQQDYVSWDFGDKGTDLLKIYSGSSGDSLNDGTEDSAPKRCPEYRPLSENTSLETQKKSRRITSVVQDFSRVPLADITTNREPGKGHKRKMIAMEDSDDEEAIEDSLNSNKENTHHSVGLKKEKLTQTVTYNYGHKKHGYRVSEIGD